MEDDEFGQVRALLRTVEPPPGNVDVASVLGAGRRGERRHRLTVALTAGGLTAIVLVGAVRRGDLRAQRPRRDSGGGSVTQRTGASDPTLDAPNLHACRCCRAPWPEITRTCPRPTGPGESRPAWRRVVIPRSVR